MAQSHPIDHIQSPLNVTNLSIYLSKGSTCKVCDSMKKKESCAVYSTGRDDNNRLTIDMIVCDL